MDGQDSHSFNADSAVKPKMPEARCNPGAASLGSKRSSRLSRSKRFERFELFERIELHLLTKTHRLRCGRVVPRVSVDPNCGIRVQQSSRSSAYGFPEYLFVHSTPSLAGGALARSLTMPAPIEKSKTFCQPSWFILPQVGMAGAIIE